MKRERVQVLINDSKYRFHLQMRVHESDLRDVDCQAAIFFSGTGVCSNHLKSENIGPMTQSV